MYVCIKYQSQHILLIIYQNKFKKKLAKILLSTIIIIK